MAARSHPLKKLLAGFGVTCCAFGLAPVLSAQSPPEPGPPPPPGLFPPPERRPQPPPEEKGKPPREMWKNLSEAERDELRQRGKSMREEIHRRVEQVLTELGLAPDSPERERIKRAYLDGRREIERKIFQEMQQVRKEREKLLIEKLRQELATKPTPQSEAQKEPSSKPSSD